MKNNLYPTNHDFYASGNNFFSMECGQEFKDWESFYEEYQDADVDMNLVFRWDIFELNEEKPGLYYMQIIIIGQRKGLYIPIRINSVLRSDEKQIIEFMRPHFDKIIKNWDPLRNLFLSV